MKPKNETKQTSSKRVEANRRNAKKSTGPTSSEGKAKSALNGLKHGLTAQSVVLPNESREDYEARLTDWLARCKPSGPMQAYLVERAVHASWRLDRCARQETATLAQSVRHACLDFDVAQSTRAIEIGSRLLYEPLNRCQSVEFKDPVVRARLDRRERDDPGVLTRELQSFAQGVAWLLERWGEVAAILEREGYLHYPDKFKAIRLLGKWPHDLLEDALVQRVFLACNAAHPEAWDLWDEAHQARLGVVGKPMYVHLIEALKEDVPKSFEAGQAILWDVINTEIVRLTRLKSSILDPIEDADRASAETRAMFDERPTGVNFKRYEAACERTFHKAVADFAKLRKDPVDECQDDVFTDPEPTSPEPAEVELQTEPIAEVQVSQTVETTEPTPAPIVRQRVRQPRGRRRLSQQPPAIIDGKLDPNGANPGARWPDECLADYR